MFVSVIISTYNSAERLEKVLWGYAAQTHRDFEIVVADDGSTDRTAAMLDEMARETGLELHRVWHPHQGFRKCAILNRAIEAARAEYLLFTDGDCVPRWDFIAQHVAHARRGRFLSGGAVRLPLALSEAIEPDHIQFRQFLKPLWLFRNGLGWNKKILMILSGPRLGAVLDFITTTRATFNGGNASLWKADALRVNGFDERMGYGGLDREFGERLVHAGVQPVQIRHRAVCLHLEDARDYVSAKIRARNAEIRRDTQQHRLAWTPYGSRKRRP